MKFGQRSLCLEVFTAGSTGLEYRLLCRTLYTLWHRTVKSGVFMSNHIAKIESLLLSDDFSFVIQGFEYSKHSHRSTLEPSLFLFVGLMMSVQSFWHLERVYAHSIRCVCAVWDASHTRFFFYTQKNRAYAFYRTNSLLKSALLKALDDRPSPWTTEPTFQR